MGHRSSKSAIANSSDANSHAHQYSTTPRRRANLLDNSNNSSSRIPISSLPGTTINVQIDESPTIDIVNDQNPAESSDSSSSLNSLTGSNSLQNRQIIIKIQLAKMENGNNELDPDGVPQMQATLRQSDIEASTIVNDLFTQTSNGTIDSSNAASTQFVNLTLNGNLIFADEGETSPSSELASLSSTKSNSRNFRTAGSSKSLNHHNKNNPTLSPSSSSLEQKQHNAHDLRIRLDTLYIQEDWEQHQSNDNMPEYCEVLEESIGGNSSTSTVNESRRSDASLPDNVGCVSSRRKAKKVSTVLPSSASSLVFSGRRCKNAIRRILEPTAKLSNNKSKEQNKQKIEAFQTPKTLPVRHSMTSTTMQVLPSTSTAWYEQGITNSDNLSAGANAASNSVIPITVASVATKTSTPFTTANQNGIPTTIWTPSRNVIIPITSPPQFVVVQCAPSSVLTLGRIDENAIRLTTTSADISSGAAAVNSVNANCSELTTTTAMGPSAPNLTRSFSNGPIVHSQVDFVHCLVPDLNKIVNSSFYWGKIDRYEAERLLEGKPEGTFLLRDSAQEEYLFSVTFRKYERSLHARIEQSGHKFGFDCHDPGVFTAPTVTGLLQHYKDPAFVMFFEPTLTIPLHRKTVFSLQELARAVIVSNTTYDGVNELGLPLRVKSFLKEYHYKQKLRVKPCDEPFYSCT